MKKKNGSRTGKRNKKKRFPWWLLAPVFLAAGVLVAIQLKKNKNGPATRTELPRATVAQPSQPAPNQAVQPAPATGARPPGPPASNDPPLEINQAVMVTVELDFGENVPSIAEALTHIERRHYPEDGIGRTFAILDAYGMPTEENKLHLSMHVSTEQPGKGMLVFKRTGEVLWEHTIVAGANQTPTAQKNLLVLVDNGEGKNKSWTIDGSNNPVSILDANVKQQEQPLKDLWPDGTEREFTFVYSACGCPVKVMVRRQGNDTFRSSDQPVMFPDDPDALRVIHALMGW